MHSHKRYLLTLLAAILVVNYADRLVFGVVLQDIKAELDLTDTQLGFLSGIAFALFYAVMGIPLARWADRGNRVTIISLTVALWSAATALCGAATSFVQLLLVRIGVAVGEAGCLPTSLSLISDYFPRGERARAVSRFALGIPIALVVGYFASGWLNELYGWRATFVIIGLPGVGLAIVTAFTLKEPRLAQGVRTAPEQQPRLREVFTALWANVSYRHLLFAFAVWGFFGNGILQWQPAFFIRSHGLTTGELGTWLALVQGAGTFIGTYLGGEAATRYARHNERLQLHWLIQGYVVLAFLGAAAYLAPAHELAFGILGVYSLISGAANAPLFAVIQTIVPSRMRAMAMALMYFFCNLIGLGLGPLAVGIVSDALRPVLAEDSLRYALLAFCPGYFWCAWHFWRASRTVERDLALVQTEAEKVNP